MWDSPHLYRATPWKLLLCQAAAAACLEGLAAAAGQAGRGQTEVLQRCLELHLLGAAAGTPIPKVLKLLVDGQDAF